MKKTIKTTSLALLMLLSINAIAENVEMKAEINFEQPEMFMDFRSREVLTEIDKNRLTTDLRKHMQMTIKKTLPADQRMRITITNVDMAGNIFPGSNEIRKVNNNTDRSLIEFDYEILNSDGKTIKQGHEKLVNLYFNNAMNREAKKFPKSRFKYELVIFSRWLNKVS